MGELGFPIGSDNRVNISSDSKAEAKKGEEKGCEKESLFGVYSSNSAHGLDPSYAES